MHEAAKTDAREGVISAVMRDDPELTREAAEALYDEATREAGPSKIRVELSDATVAFRDVLIVQGVTFPFNCGSGETGEIYDAAGNPILVVDVNRERPDAEVMTIAMFVVRACNERAKAQAQAEADQ